MKTSEKINEYISKQGEASAKELADYLGISQRAVFKQLKNLTEKGGLVKKGVPPRVYYLLPTFDVSAEDKLSIKDSVEVSGIDHGCKDFIEKNFYQITATGQVQIGFKGFISWCQKRSLPIDKTAKEYKSTLESYHKYFNKYGLINGFNKFKSTYNEVYIDEIYYLDFYSIERFGKTKLGQKLLYAKQSQDRRLILDLINEIEPKINELIKNKKVNAVGFIPPTVKREVQFIREMEKGLKLQLPIIKIVKISTDIVVPQKTLSKLEDRIENAKISIVVDDNRSFENVLLIDDAVGSGATLNETAKSLKQKGVAKKIIGLSITGSFKGFDVISEV